MHSPNPLVPPIFVSDENTYCFEWNTAMEKLSVEIFGEAFTLCGLSMCARVRMGTLELEKGEFFIASVIDAVVSQVMLLLRERGVQLIWDIPDEIKILRVYGDQVGLQQVFADFLQIMASHAPSQEVHLRPSMKQISDGVTVLHIEFRIVCPGEDLPPNLIQDMFHNSQWITQEGLGLSMCRRILQLMNGEVQYIRQSEKSLFLIILELPMPQSGSMSAK